MTGIAPYQGNGRIGMRESATFRLRRGGGEDFRIELLYPLDHRDVALLSNEGHQPLVEMVLRAQHQIRGAEGGRFVINEFGHVLVRDSGTCYRVGTYHDHINFEFENRLIGPAAPPGLEPGQDWEGPGVGIRYTANANNDDVYFDGATGRRMLSRAVGESAARRLVSRLARHRPGGGNLYINQAREFFAVPIDGRPPFIYLGSLGADAWFNEPA